MHGAANDGLNAAITATDINAAATDINAAFALYLAVEAGNAETTMVCTRLHKSTLHHS
jgi:thiazole synthase ThiGH ThiG subunit